MAYLLLIVEPLGQREERGVEGGQRAYASMLDFTGELKAAGVLMASSSLATASTRLRRPAAPGPALVTDGPFAETKEMLGGFFLLDCLTREEALAWAERCPAATWATVEVRETGPCFT